MDIETSPHLAYVWSLWKQNIPLPMLAQSGQTLCFAAKWYREPEVFWHSLPDGDMLEQAWKYLDQADAVVTYYGTAFDIPTLNGEFFREGMPPPSPAKQIDLKKVVSKKFRLPSNKLQYVSNNLLNLGGKEETGGFSTWLGCMNNDPEAWARMEEYNRRDVVVMEPIYDQLLPWIDNHPNRNLYREEQGCPNCASTDLRKEGHAYTLQGSFQRYQCRGCGRWSRGTKRVAAVDYVGEK
ncbi:ribonuclease H-like domain-containing protein [Micromonospora sp. CB01531]|uniref:ribonuclease H-like domain-containing protein n=1 Tax=Micromonospora sp. CB01531 TaxID=1718947 RepID=UPI0009402BA6|nr:ribonuclease H-like domain-containing protein [Micromonospora sp. CB01531]OKI54559.1 hypothetical protein A6A27_32040 [Micromonospora sp. CB01531]